MLYGTKNGVKAEMIERHAALRQSKAEFLQVLIKKHRVILRCIKVSKKQFSLWVIDQRRAIIDKGDISAHCLYGPR